MRFTGGFEDLEKLVPCYCSLADGRKAFLCRSHPAMGRFRAIVKNLGSGFLYREAVVSAEEVRAIDNAPASLRGNSPKGFWIGRHGTVYTLGVGNAMGRASVHEEGFGWLHVNPEVVKYAVARFSPTEAEEWEAFAFIDRSRPDYNPEIIARNIIEYWSRTPEGIEWKMANDWHMKVPEIAEAVRRRTTPDALEERRVLLETRVEAGDIVTLRAGRTVLIAVGDECGGEGSARLKLGTMRSLFITDPLAPEKGYETVEVWDIARVVDKGEMTVSEARKFLGESMWESAHIQVRKEYRQRRGLGCKWWAQWRKLLGRHLLFRRLRALDAVRRRPAVEEDECLEAAEASVGIAAEELLGTPAKRTVALAELLESGQAEALKLARRIAAMYAAPTGSLAVESELEPGDTGLLLAVLTEIEGDGLLSPASQVS